MTQHPIDLLPDAIRARSEAGMRMGRYLAALAGSILIVVALTTHARLGLHAARVQLTTAEADANLVLAAEAEVTTLEQEMAGLRAYIDRYEQVALPLQLSRVLATIVNELPESVSLDRIDLESQMRRAGGAARSRGQDKTAGGVNAPRVLVGELGGFAASDQDITDLVARLERTPPFREVSLDYSRTRMVRDQGAREFRVSFRIDLEARYVLADAESTHTPTAAGTPGAAGPTKPHPAPHAAAGGRP
jgi:Tfp pilus assembly protein PilN